MTFPKLLWSKNTDIWASLYQSDLSLWEFYWKVKSLRKVEPFVLRRIAAEHPAFGNDSGCNVQFLVQKLSRWQQLALKDLVMSGLLAVKAVSSTYQSRGMLLSVVPERCVWASFFSWPFASMRNQPRSASVTTKKELWLITVENSS